MGVGNRTRRQQPERRGERGTSVVEFALVASLLCLLLFGIIEFGVILAVKASTQQAASEGARAAVTQLWCPAGSSCQYPNNANTPSACRGMSVTPVSAPDPLCLQGAASDQAGKTMSWLSTCGTSATAAVQCTTTADYCTPGQPSTGLCVTTNVNYDYKDNPIFPSLPLLSGFLPDWIKGQSVVKVNPCAPPQPSGGAPNCG